MENDIPPTPRALDEALSLSGEILKDIELSTISLAKVALKASRLARLLNQDNPQRIFAYEASGYPTTPGGVAPEVWKLLEMAGRTYQEKDSNSKDIRTLAFLESIEQLEEQITAAKIGLEAAKDHDISISSANPNQFVMAPGGNFLERQGLHARISTASQRLSSRRTLLYQYATRRHYELKFSGVAQDVFSRVREEVDFRIGKHVPSAVQKFAAVHDNLTSENPEDWSNAVHSCRRILQDLADALFPHQTDDRIRDEKGKQRHIKLGPDQYINRLMCFVEDRGSSARFADLVGSHLGFLGDRLDAVFLATQKGSHSTVKRDEANRYVVFTYMVVGDILALLTDEPKGV
jgi:hypothetical protein